jgi:phage/plasmid-associated DNA primase
MPAFNHRDAALRERVKVIGMHVEIPPEARRARYWEMFESELPGIFYWALEGLGRVMAKGWQSSLPPWLPSDLPPVFVPLDKLGHGPHGR